MRRRRTLYLALLIGCALSVASVTVSMLRLDHVLVASGGGGFAVAPGFARLPLPWWLQVSMVALAYVLAVAAIVLAFEAIGRWLDPGDHSAGSLAWAMKGWLPALVVLATCMAIAVVLGTIVAWWATAEAGGGGAFQLLATAIYFFIWNARFVAAPRPSLRLLRPRWPGIVAILLPVCFFALGSFVADKLGPGPTGDKTTVVSVAACFLVFFFFGELAWRWLWLNRSSRLLGALQVALRPRVFLPGLLLELRGLLAACAPVFVLLPIAWFLIQGVPVLERELAMSPAGTGMFFVQASRFAIAWWWAIVIVLAGVALGAWTAWYRPVAAARLLHQLGLVRGEIA